ncbi:MAG: hypothetical protein J6A94_06005 [Lachnospiraceae bacterium]|nr:hypothetical protein [Lachnospiraceae bacterium]
MTYEQFKRELFRNVSEQGSHNRQFSLLERGTKAADVVLSEEKEVSDPGEFFPETSMSSLNGKRVKEDYLYVQWNAPIPAYMRSWNIRALYEKYKQEGWQGVLPEIIGEGCIVHLPDKDTKRTIYEKNSEHFILRPMNYRRNREELADCIYWRYGDIALVLHEGLGEEGRDYITVKIRRYMVEKWNIVPERMLTNALINTYAKMPPRLFLAGDVRFFYNWEDGVFMPGESGRRTMVKPRNREEALRGYRLTTTKMKDGAIAIFYPGVQERIGELLGGDFLVGFTSIHQVVIHPARYKSINDMKSAIRRINAVYDEKDMLTNTIYRYCCTKKKMVEV